MPTATTITALVNQLCVYFGGPYDATRRLYGGNGSPPIAGLYTLHRARPKSLDAAFNTLGASSPKPLTAAIGWISVGDSGGYGGGGDVTEERIAVAGATSGVKKVSAPVDFVCTVRSLEPHAEVIQDFTYTLIDSILALIRADRTCGSGGFELGGFQVAETGPWLRWRLGDVTSSAQVSKQALVVMTEAHYYVQA